MKNKIIPPLHIAAKKNFAIGKLRCHRMRPKESMAINSQLIWRSETLCYILILHATAHLIYFVFHWIFAGSSQDVHVLLLRIVSHWSSDQGALFAPIHSIHMDHTLPDLVTLLVLPSQRVEQDSGTKPDCQIDSVMASGAQQPHGL